MIFVGLCSFMGILLKPNYIMIWDYWPRWPFPQLTLLYRDPDEQTSTLNGMTSYRFILAVMSCLLIHTLSARVLTSRRDGALFGWMAAWWWTSLTIKLFDVLSMKADVPEFFNLYTTSLLHCAKLICNHKNGVWEGYLSEWDHSRGFDD